MYDSHVDQTHTLEVRALKLYPSMVFGVSSLQLKNLVSYGGATFQREIPPGVIPFYELAAYDQPTLGAIRQCMLIETNERPFSFDTPDRKFGH